MSHGPSQPPDPAKPASPGLDPRDRAPREFRVLRGARSRVVEAIARKRRSEAAGAADALKAQLLAMISHELRTPLTVIVAYAKLLESGTLGALSAEQQRGVERIARHGEILSSNVSDLLHMATVQAGLYHPVASPHCLPELIREALERLKSALGARTVQLDMPENLPLVQVDGNGQVKVLTHLLRNAIQHTTDQGTITVRLRRSAGLVVCEVGDDGAGIPAAAIATLFEPFSHLEARAAGRAEGLGLGLALCRAIVEAHGGTIGVVSEVGQGSRFWFTLPAAR